jgi:drug/metabolite transporter (DMT)-like permease
MLINSKKSRTFALSTIMRYPVRALLAFFFICIAWGTTYLAIKIGVTAWPAFLYAGIRQVISGIIIITVALSINKNADLSRKNILHQLLIGFLMITIGNGFVTWSEKFIPSSVAALICAMMPVCAVVINLGINKNERMNALIAVGMALGFCSVALNFKNNFADLGKSKYVIGIIATFIATCSWALGSIVNKKKKAQINPIFNSGLQLGFGGLFLLVGSPFIDNYSKADFYNKDALWALIYLIVIGSVLAYTAYMYALKELPVGLVMVYAYINPLVAVFLGFLLLNEPLNVFTALSFTSILLGVFLVNRGYKQQASAAAIVPLEE